MPSEIKLCECGCGQPAPLAPQNNKSRGWVKGEPLRFARNHGARKRRPLAPAWHDDTAKYIALTKNKFVLVDASDYDWLNQYWWQDHGGYAGRDDNSKTVLMHNQIMNPPIGLEVDHRNLDKLDCRRANMRLGTHTQNLGTHTQNLGNIRSKKGTSRYKGVYLAKPNAWVAQISVNGKTFHLGSFRHEDDAAKAYDAAALVHFGEFARCNFPQEESSNA